MLTVLSILSSVTERITQGRTSKFIPRIYLIIYLPSPEKFFKRLARRDVVEDALQRLDELTLEEAQMAPAEEGSIAGGRTTPHSMPTAVG